MGTNAASASSLSRPPRERARARMECLVVAAAVIGALLVPALAGALTVARRPGGAEIVFDRREGSDVVCVMAAVQVGSSCETPETRGASHFVEHLVFDGSERYTREEISGWADDAGAFLNAFTRQEATVYFLLVSSAQLEKGIEILSQMLLHSVFLPQELEKERKVIIEEIRRETDDPRSARDRMVDRCLYRGSPLAEPVIGYAATLETMSASTVEAFYREHYVPSNMRIVIMGGFDPGAAERLIGEYFPPRSGEPGVCTSPPPAWGGEVTVRTGTGETPGFDVLVPFPPVGTRNFPAALLVSKMLEGDDSPLAKKLAALSLPAPEVGLEIHRGFSALRIHVDGGGARAGGGATASASYAGVSGALESLAAWMPANGEIETARTSFLSGEMFDREIYHLYVMMRGEAIALHGERYLSQCGAVAQVTRADCVRFLKSAFRPSKFNACLVREEPDAPAPAQESRAPAIEALPNGCLIGALERPGSPVAALHLLLRGRACGGGAAPPGSVEMLVTMLETSDAGRALSKRLESLGARVQYGDNPYVPQDDYLLSPSYAFIRLEAPAGSLMEAASLLVHHLLGSAATEEDLDRLKQALAREVGMRSASPYYAMRGAMMAALFGSHPYAAPIFPSPPSMMRVSLDDLQEIRGRLFAGGNIIATLVSPETPARGCRILAELLGDVPEGAAIECPPLPDSVKAGSIETTIRKEGAYVAAGWLASCPDPSATASLLVAAEVLSRRMQLELREKRGLSYSIGCSGEPLPGGVVLTAYLGTGAERLEEACAALEREIRGLREHPPDAGEVGIAENRLLARRSRSELASINEAYALGLDLLLGGSGGYRSMKRLIATATPDDVNESIAASMGWDRAVVLRLVPEASGAR
jgi:zinc protease